MDESRYLTSELESMDLWDTVDRIKAKILWETENENKDIQAMMISFEVNQIINELLQVSMGFTRKIVTSK
jgi:hypothetical protein